MASVFCKSVDCSPPGSSVHGFPRQEYWSGLPCPSPGDLPNPGIEPVSLTSPALAGKFFFTGATWETHISYRCAREWVTIFKDYTPPIVIIKYWLYSLCHTLYILIAYFIHSSLCLLTVLSFPLPSLYWQPLVCSLYLWTCFFFVIFFVYFVYFLDFVYFVYFLDST